MVNVYRLLRLLGVGALPEWAKLSGIWSLYLLRRRIAGVFIDPVMGCNLRCRMCYFSDPVKCDSMKGVIGQHELECLERAILPYALKMQIGCGTEPTLYGDLPGLIARGKRSGVPYISLTTNGQLIASGRISLDGLVEAGLDEITLSMHGTDRDSYEYMMPGADFSLVKRLIGMLALVKARKPKFQVRVNFTVNSRNLDCLKGNAFWQIWEDAGFMPDIVQLRPVQKIGNTDWTDFDMKPLMDEYQVTFRNIVERCREEGIVCISPTPEALSMVHTDQSQAVSIIEDVTYCYVSPGAVYKNGFDVENDTFYTYNGRMKTGRRLFAAIFGRGSKNKPGTTKKLNYKINK